MLPALGGGPPGLFHGGCVMTPKHKAEIYTGGALAIALVFLNATRAFSGPSEEQINAAIKTCVAVTRAGEVQQGIKPYFDAYYNAATGAVHNNVMNIAGRADLFVFGKCMAEHGFPLGNKDEGK